MKEGWWTFFDHGNGDVSLLRHPGEIARGELSIDILLDAVKEKMREYNAKTGRGYLVNADGELLVGYAVCGAVACL